MSRTEDAARTGFTSCIVMGVRGVRPPALPVGGQSEG